jgi:hypothetical protein
MAAPPAGDDAPKSACADIAELALDEAGVQALRSMPASFACAGNFVVATANKGTTRERRVERKIQFSNEKPATTPDAGASSEDPLAVPFSTDSVLGTQSECLGEINTEIKSELQDFTWGCINYGQINLDTGEIVWERHIDIEWNMYPGWNSPQNTLRTIPSAGSPTMSGTFTTYQQNGILAPIPKSASLFSNYGNDFTSGWNPGGTTQDAKYSVWMGDVNIQDNAKAFDEYFDGVINGHRFECDSELERCYFPNGEEAGVF